MVLILKHLYVKGYGYEGVCKSGYEPGYVF